MSPTVLLWGDRPTPKQLVMGEGCYQGIQGCRCACGYCREEQCPDCCADVVRSSRCVCGAPGEKKKKGLTLTRKFVPKSPVAEFEATDFEAALLHYRQWKKEQGEHVQDG